MGSRHSYEPHPLPHLAELVHQLCYHSYLKRRFFLKTHCYVKGAVYLKVVKFVLRTINFTPTDTHFKLYHLVSNFPLYHACFIETSK